MEKAIELRDLSFEELEAKREEIRKELFELQGEKKQRKLKQPHLLKLTKRKIARIETILNEKK